MAMMFDITEAVKEYLLENNEVQKSEHDLMIERMNSANAAKETKEQAEQRENRAKQDYVSSLEWVAENAGQAVTKDNFKTWKELFDAQKNMNTTILVIHYILLC
uniref:Uncharacterized protein n=1 Tax=Lotharella globosa TaxID=91324 RepID=A0A7S3YNN4_9EUKA